MKKDNIIVRLIEKNDSLCLLQPTDATLHQQRYTDQISMYRQNVRCNQLEGQSTLSLQTRSKRLDCLPAVGCSYTLHISALIFCT